MAIVGKGSRATRMGCGCAIAYGIVLIRFNTGVDVNLSCQSIVGVVVKRGAVAIKIGVADLVACGIVDKAFHLPCWQGSGEYAT